MLVQESVVSTFTGNRSAASIGASVEEDSSRYVEAGILFAFFALAFVGNAGIIANLLHTWRHCLRNMHNMAMLCLHLALADLIATFCCILSNAILYLTENFVAGDIGCKLLRFLQRFALIASTFIVVTISLDRCTAVLFPLHKACLRRTTTFLVFGIWITAACFSLPQNFMFEIRNSVSADGAARYECAAVDKSENEWIFYLHDLASLIFLYVVPVAIIIKSYALLCAKLTQESTSDSPLLCRKDSVTEKAFQKRQALYQRARRTTLTISVIVIVTFVVCWAPYYTSLVIHLVARPDPSVDYYYSHAIYFCGLGHSVLNPLMYGLFHLVKRRRLTQRRQACQNAIQSFNATASSFRYRPSVVSRTVSSRSYVKGVAV